MMLGIQIHWQIKWTAEYPTKPMAKAAHNMIPIAPSMGSVPGRTAAKHSAPATAARIPKMLISRMTISEINELGYLL